LSDLLALFSNNILPIFLTASAGYLASKYLHVTPRPVSQVGFYIFSPCLVFNLLTTSELNGEDISRMVVFATLSMLAVGLLAFGVGSLLRFERRLLVAVLLTAVFSNAGNYGLSLNRFAFGEEALAHASLFFVTSAILTYTAGVVIASLGSMSFAQAMAGLLRVPAVYAVILALLFNRLGWSLPLPLDRSITIMAEAAIPILLVLMGIQLQHARWDGKTGPLALISVLRLAAAPALALAVNLALRLQGPAFQAGLLEAAMPTAVNMTILATEYDVEPSLVTTAVFTTTLLSPLTVTPLLAFLGAR
jgi:predicted permease